MERRRSPAPWIAAVAVVAAIGAGVALWMRRGEISTLALPRSPSADAGAEVASGPEDAGMPLTSAPSPDADALLRRLASSGSPLLASWLASDGILQRIAAAVRLAAIGRSPKPVLGFIEIEGDFTVIEEKDRITIAPASYARYDALVGAVRSLDPIVAGRAYRELRTHFDAAYGQVARPGERFDDVLSSAITRCTAVPIPSGPVEVVEVGALYAFRDPALESLSPIEKQWLRLGPTNMKSLRSWLEKFSAAADLPKAAASR
jgi:hypothetical protein